MDAITQLIPAKPAPIGNAAGGSASDQASESENFARSLANEQAQASDKRDASNSTRKPETNAKSDSGPAKDSGNSAAVAVKPQADNSTQKVTTRENGPEPLQRELDLSQALQDGAAKNDAKVTKIGERSVEDAKPLHVENIEAAADAPENTEVAQVQPETPLQEQFDTQDTSNAPLLQVLTALTSAQPAAKPAKEPSQQARVAEEGSIESVPTAQNNAEELIAAPEAVTDKPKQVAASLPAQQNSLNLSDQKPLATDTAPDRTLANLDEQIKTQDADPETQITAPTKTVRSELPAQTSQAERPIMVTPLSATTQTATSTDTLQMKPVPEVTVQIPQQRADVAAKHVGLEISRQAAKSETHFAIRMDPPELGKLDVKLTLTKSAEVQATIVVEREATFDLLSRDMKALERALQEAGLKTDQNSLQLSLKNQGFGQGEEGSSGANGLADGRSDGNDDGIDDMEGVIAAKAMQHSSSDRPVDIII